MQIEPGEVLETGVAALLFAATFLVGRRLHPLQSLVRDHRTIASFGAGISAAYVFVHLMPELHGARTAFADSMSTPLRYEGMAIYFFALVGFLAFYALAHMRIRARNSASRETGGPSFRLDLGGFAVYVWLMTYLMLRGLEGNSTSILLYAVAFTFHFLAVDRAMDVDYGAAYERLGRYVLAGMAAVGWVSGMLLPLPPEVIAPLLAFISGAVIVNSAIVELPSGENGRLVPFVTGALLYGLILMPLG